MKAHTASFFLISLFFLLNACQFTQPSDASAKQAAWEKVLRDQLGLLGHRNWVVVADAAYPLQSSEGILTIASGEDHVSTVRKTHEILSSQPHVNPIVYLDRESAFLTEGTAPGIAGYREAINGIFMGKETKEELHEEIIRKLDETARLYQVLIIKTDFTVPYTTVFFQLDCAYWDSEDEAALRELMLRKQHTSN